MACYKNGGCGVYENRSCSECPASKPEYLNKNIETEKLNRLTALRVLQDLSSCMYPNYDLFGNKTLVINRDKFEKIRAKYLDKKDG